MGEHKTIPQGAELRAAKRRDFHERKAIESDIRTFKARRLRERHVQLEAMRRAAVILGKS